MPLSPQLFGEAPPIDGTSVAFFGAGSGDQQGIYVLSQGPPIKIADAATAIPGGTGNFTSFGDVSLSDTDVAFLGIGAAGQQGIYNMTGGRSARWSISTTSSTAARSLAGACRAPESLYARRRPKVS